MMNDRNWECDNRSDNWQVDEKTKQLTHRQLTHILSKRKSSLYSGFEFPGINQRHPNILETKRLCMSMSRVRRDGERFFLQGTCSHIIFPERTSSIRRELARFSLDTVHIEIMFGKDEFLIFCTFICLVEGPVVNVVIPILS